MRNKIALVGSGNIGGTLAHLAAIKELGDVTLFDIAEGIPQGKSLDLAQSGPVENFDSKMIGSNDYKDLKDSDVVIVTAGVARKPGMSRDDLIEINFSIIKQIGKAIKKYCPKAFIICVTNPLDAMVWSLKTIAKINKKMIVGMAGILDSSRFKYFLSNELKVSMECIQTMVLGGHGDTMVPLLRFTSVSGIPIHEFISKGLITDAKLQEIVDRTRNGGGEIVSLLKDSSAFFSPALSVIEMIESFIFDQKKLLPCSAFLDGEYNVRDIFAGVPVIIGGNGLEKILELKLNDREKREFKESTNSVKKLINKCKKLLV